MGTFRNFLKFFIANIFEARIFESDPKFTNVTLLHDEHKKITTPEGVKIKKRFMDHFGAKGSYNF